MKKLFAVILCLLMTCFACTALADYEVGDTVEVFFSVNNPNGACNFNVYLDYEPSVFEYVQINPAGGLYGGPNGFGYAAMTPFAGGSIGSVEFRIKEGAVPGKTYYISGYADASVDENFNPVDIVLSGGATVKIKGAACTTHTWNSGTVTTEATCTSTGVMKYTCTACGEIKEETLPVIDHVGGAPVVTKLASCAAAGEQTISCTMCGELLETEVIEPLEHVEGDTVVTKQPTCTEPGSQVTQCANCGKTIATAPVAPIDHTVVVDPAVAATCTATGLSEGKHCSVCDLVITEQNVVEKLPHTKGEATVTKEPTCTEKGQESYKCTVCGTEIENAEIPMIDHDVVVDAAVAATCTATGLTEGKHCSVCDLVITEQNVVEKLPHTKGEATVTKEPTCTEKGQESYKCTVCGTEIENAEIPELPHKEGAAKETKAATCTEKGEKVTACETCGAVLKTEVIEKLPHTKGEATVTKEPTCTEKGQESYKCTVCGAEIENAEIPMIDHDVVVDAAVAATCTATGLSEGKHCSVCDLVITEQTVVEKLPHTKGEATVTKEPTCTEKGQESYKCTICGTEIENAEIPELEHKEGAAKVTKAATCTEKGEKVTACETCGEVLKTEVIAEEGHDDGEWIVVKHATTEKKGLKELRCTKCDAVLASEEIPVIKAVYYPNNTACSVGPCFRDESNLTDKWYRFTPVDLSVDGVYTYDLAASNLYVIGQVTVTVADGNVTVECDYVSREINVKSEFCTFLPSLSETTTLDQEQLVNYPFGEPISIENDLAGDTKVLLFICNVVDYHTDMPIEVLPFKTIPFKREIEAMKELMD